MAPCGHERALWIPNASTGYSHALRASVRHANGTSFRFSAHGEPWAGFGRIGSAGLVVTRREPRSIGLSVPDVLAGTTIGSLNPRPEGMGYLSPCSSVG